MRQKDYSGSGSYNEGYNEGHEDGFRDAIDTLDGDDVVKALAGWMHAATEHDQETCVSGARKVLQYVQTLMRDGK